MKFIFLTVAILAATFFLPSQGQSQVVAELPQVYMDTTYPTLPAGHKILTVGKGKLYSQCQYAVEAAEPGDEIVIDAGFVCTPVAGLSSSPIELLNKGPSTLPIVIRSAKSTTLPIGTRVSLADEPDMAIVEVNSVAPAVIADEGAHDYRLVGLEMRVNSNF